MNIVTPYARIVNLPDREAGIQLLKKIEFCGRISHRSEEAQTEDSWQRFIPSVVLNRGDWSITEHSSVTVDLVADRGVTHELVRHRHFSFTQESQRFVNYQKKKSLAAIEPNLSSCSESALEEWKEAMEFAERKYTNLLVLGASPQIARSVLPNSVASRIIVTGNLRAWRHFLRMRTTKETHPHFLDISLPLLQEFQAKVPFLYDDIIPGASQSLNVRLPA